MLGCKQCGFAVFYPPLRGHKKHCLHTNPFDQRATAYRRVGYAYPHGWVEGSNGARWCPPLPSAFWIP